ncbi:MAG: cache domain-containing protein [Bacteroidota bacterium]
MNRLLKRQALILLLIPLLIEACNKNDASKSSSQIDELTANKKTTVAVVHASAVGLGELLKKVADSATKVLTIRTFIDSVRFYQDNSGYFYVYNYQCINIAHATQPDLEGQNLYDYQDSKGKYVIRELSKAASKGGGFVEYFWIKPGETGEKLKIGYVEPIPGTNFFIGSGVYVPETK